MISKELLEELGLTKNESEIFLILIPLIEEKANQIAKKTNISRSHVYDSLNNLVEKGFVSFKIKNSIKYYQSNVDKIIYNIQDKIKNLEEKKKTVIKEIKYLKKKSKEMRPKVEVFEGIEGIKTILNDVIKTKKEALVFNSIPKEDFTKHVPDIVLERYYKDRVKHKIHSRQIYAEGIKVAKHPFGKYKAVAPEYFNDKVSLFVYGNKIAYFILIEKPLSIRIESKEVADLYKKHFEIFWRTTKVPSS